MTDTKKFDTIVPIVTKPVEEIPTPAQQMIEDSAAKKKIIYHQPPRKNSYATDKARYNELCGDSYKISLGYPMTWIEFNQLSDSMKKEYIESILEKYPGISNKTMAKMFNANPQLVKFEVNRLGICFIGRADNNVQHKYKLEIEEIKSQIELGESPKNLDIERKEDLSKLRRKHYKQVKSMDPVDALKYINGIYERYAKSLSINDFAEMLGVSSSTISVLFKDIGFKFAGKRNFCNTNEAKAVRAKFREEMIEPNQKKYIKRKYTRKAKEEAPADEIVETVAATSEPVKEKIVVEAKFVPMSEVPAVEFYDPATVIDGCVPAEREIEDHIDEEPVVDVGDIESTEPEFNISGIDAEVDVDKIADFIKYIGFTGKVKIHIEKI